MPTTYLVHAQPPVSPQTSVTPIHLSAHGFSPTPHTSQHPGSGHEVAHPTENEPVTNAGGQMSYATRTALSTHIFLSVCLETDIAVPLHYVQSNLTAADTPASRTPALRPLYHRLTNTNIRPVAQVRTDHTTVELFVTACGRNPNRYCFIISSLTDDWTDRSTALSR